MFTLYRDGGYDLCCILGGFNCRLLQCESNFFYLYPFQMIRIKQVYLPLCLLLVMSVLMLSYNSK